jgi:hypothetical protein
MPLPDPTRVSGGDSIQWHPDFNPIEKAFTHLKAILRAKAERTVESLWDTCGRVVTMFEPQV